jgi:spore coat polysaccharide biosynthesis protein SpsF
VPERRVVALVQARMGSSRLPGKVLLRAAGRTLLDHLVTRLQRARTLSAIVIATTDAPADDAIEAEAMRLSVGCVRGSELVVRARFHEAATRSAAGVVVRVTADCPLLDPAEVDRVVEAFLTASPPVDYAANFEPDMRRIPLGLSVEVFSVEALERAHREGGEPHHREHVTPYIYECSARFRTLALHPPEDLSHLRLTVDTPEDLSVVGEVLEGLEGQQDAVSLSAALRWLDAHPGVAQRNAGIRQKSFRETDGAVAAGLVALFRGDASPEVGAGHVMRLFGVAEAWVLAGGRACFLGMLPPSIRDRLEGLGIEVIALAHGMRTGSPEDARAVRELAEARGAAVVALDGYLFDRRYLAAIQGRQVTTMFVDDYAQSGLPVDIVLDPNAGASDAPRGEGADRRPRLLAGAAYTPLRAEFRRQAPPERSFDGKPLSLLLTFGASDPSRMSLRALRCAIEVACELPLRITVLAGPMHPDLGALRAVVADTPARRPSILHDVRDVASLFASTDLAFGAAGSTAWELASMGVPMLLVQVADNQKVVIDPLVAAGAAVRLAPEAQKDDTALRDALARFLHAGPSALRAMSKAGRQLIDGRGAERVVRVLADLARH